MRNRFKINGLNIKRFTAVMVLAVLVFALSSCNGLFGGRGDRTPQKQKVTVSFSTLNDLSASINKNSREAATNTTTLPSNLSDDFSEVVKIELIAYTNDNTAYDFTRVNVTGDGVIDTEDSNGKNKISWVTSTDENNPETLITAYQKLTESTIELFCDTYKFTLNLYIETSYNPTKLVQTGTLTKEVTLETTSIAIPTTYCPEQYGDFSYPIYWTEDCGIDKIEAGLFTSESKGQTAYSIPDGKSFDFENLEVNESNDGTGRKYVNYTVENVPAGNYVFKYKLFAASPSVGSTEYISLIPNDGSYPLSVQINGYKTEKVITLDKDKLNQLSRGDGGVEIVSGPDLSIVPNPRDYFDEDVCYLNKGSFVITSDFLHNKYTDDTSFINSFDIKLYYGNNLVPLSETQYPDSLPRSDYFNLGCNSLFTFTPDDPYIKAIIFSLEDEHKLLAGGYYSLYVTAKVEGTEAISSMYYTFYVENKEYYEVWLDSYSSSDEFKSGLINKLENISTDIKLKICGNPSQTGDTPAVGYFTAITEALDECNPGDVYPHYLVDLDMSETGNRLVELSQNDWLGSIESWGNGIRSIKLSPYVQTVGSFQQLPDLEEIYFYDGGNLRLGNIYWGTDVNAGVEYFDESSPFIDAPRLSKLVIEAKDADDNPTIPKYEVIDDKIIMRTKEDSEKGNYREIFYAVSGLSDEIYGPDLSELDLTDESVWGIGCADSESTACIKAINDYAFQCADLTKIISLGAVDTLGKGVFTNCNLSEMHIDRIPENLPAPTEENLFAGTVADILYVDMAITEENYNTFKNFIIAAPNENNYRSGLEFRNVVFNQNVYMENLERQTNPNNAYDNSLCFCSCNSLKSVTFKKDAFVGDYQFFYFITLENVTFEYDAALNNESTIGKEAFEYTNLENLVLNSTSSIGAEAFMDCYNLQYVTIGPKLENIAGDNPFYGCNYLKEFTVNPDNNYYKTNPAGSILVRDASESRSYAEIISVAGNVTYFDLREEDIADLLESESTIQSIGKYAFSNCVANLNFLDLTGIVYIGDYAFAGAESWDLTDFTLPSSTIAVGLHAFDNSNGDSLFGENSSTVNFRVENTDDWYGCYNGSEEKMSTALKEWAFAENEDKPTIGSPGVTGSFVLDDEYEFTPLGDNLAESMKGNVYSCYYRDTKGND